jgi:hypothetical protein
MEPSSWRWWRSAVGRQPLSWTSYAERSTRDSTPSWHAHQHQSAPARPGPEAADPTSSRAARATFCIWPRVRLSACGTPRSAPNICCSASRLHHHFLGTEHLLLGLVSVREGVAADVLRQRKISDVDELRRHIVRRINAGPIRVDHPGAQS